MFFNREVKEIDLSLVDFDENNPRGESEEKILNDPEFDKLIESVKEDGVIIPIVVKKTNGTYKLIDGERRVRASRIASTEKINAIVVEAEVDGRALAYRIHKLQKKWKAGAENKSIKLMIEDIKNENPDISDSDINSQLRKITQLRDHSFQDQITLLEYRQEDIEEIGVSYCIQIENSFIKPLFRLYSKIEETYTESQIRDIMIDKAKRRLLVKTRFLMDDFRVVFREDFTVDEGKVIDVLKAFFNSKAKGIRSTLQELIELNRAFYEEDETDVAEEELLLEGGVSNDVEEESEEMLEIDKVEEVESEKVTVTLEKHKEKEHKFDETIEKPEEDDEVEEIEDSEDRKLRIESVVKTLTKRSQVKKRQFISAFFLPEKTQTTIGDVIDNYYTKIKTFSKREIAFISEALYALDRYCFRAATIMIWNAGLSKALSYIDQDISKFRQGCSTMKQSNRSVWRGRARDFKDQSNIITNIDDVRTECSEFQILSYLVYENVIDDSIFLQLTGTKDTRSACAHPSDINISVNRIIEIFENVYEHLLDNDKLK